MAEEENKSNSNNAADSANPGYLMYISEDSKSRLPDTPFSTDATNHKRVNAERPQKIRVMRDEFLPTVLDMPFFFIGAATSIALIGYGFTIARTPSLQQRSRNLSKISFLAQVFTFASLGGYIYRGRNRRKAAVASAQSHDIPNN